VNFVDQFKAILAETNRKLDRVIALLEEEKAWRERGNVVQCGERDDCCGHKRCNGNP
jgi:hypothetical protein